MSATTRNQNFPPETTQLSLKPSGSLIKQNRGYLARLTDILPDIVYIYHLPLQKTLFVNKAFTDILGHSQSDLISGIVDWFEIIHPDDVANASKIAATIYELKGQATMEYEIQCRTYDGNYIWLHNKLTVFTRDNKGLPEQVLVTSHDITYRKNLEKKLMVQAYTDQLTGLLNRAMFLDQLQNRINDKSHTFAVLFLDIDEFKAINDTYGHATGDKVIIKIANRLSSLLPEPSIIARLGGDEFTMILENCENEKTLNKFTSILKETLTKTMNIGNVMIQPGVSIGSTLVKEVQNPTPSKLLKMADKAMYEAKKIFYQQKLRTIGDTQS
jgi:diguanylate cyclase (GGDEF)-like protein/PAS domain S-box-containing protein